MHWYDDDPCSPRVLYPLQTSPLNHNHLLNISAKLSGSSERQTELLIFPFCNPSSQSRAVPGLTSTVLFYNQMNLCFDLFLYIHPLPWWGKPPPSPAHTTARPRSPNCSCCYHFTLVNPSSTTYTAIMLQRRLSHILPLQNSPMAAPLILSKSQTLPQPTLLY